ncbi:MAG TPA: hypothetical protein IAA45_11845 [Candidatus Blautia gallistercoris]|uniref:Uncharacterized protein n=1 Tax=Candidatus Blautia gallistercoris TaxID=2838490 RepID=A0A9D1WJS9_9FIRM|nr:hypothetical protein [Candidatus Blautia gallistercoris]
MYVEFNSALEFKISSQPEKAVFMRFVAFRKRLKKYNIARSCIVIRVKVLTRNVPQYFEDLYYEINNQINSTIIFKYSFDQHWFYEQKNENTFDIVLNLKFESVDFWVKLFSENICI